MSLIDLIRKRSPAPTATVIPATFATQPSEEDGTVAKVATVAVANPEDGPVSMLNAYARSFASHPWDLCRPSSSEHPKHECVRCGDCQHFVPDPINPPGGIGKCAITGDGSRGLLYPFKYRECGDFTERVTRIVE